MRSSALIAAALAAAAQAAPYVLTVTDVVDVYTTVTEGGQQTAVTDVAPVDNNSKWGWNGNGWSSSSQAPAAPAPTTTSTTEAPAPTTTETPTSTAAASTAAASSGSYGAPNGDTYAQRVLTHHNIHRANNSAGTVTWDNNLAEIALEIANSCNYAHNTTAGGGNYGQNIAAGAPADNITSVISDLFYNGEILNYAGLYGQATPDNINDETAFDGWGHYTQIVWKGTNSVGCATVDCTGQGNGPQGLGSVGASVPPYFTVCNYGPPGNYLGEFADNVGEPLGNPTVTWSYDY